MLTQDKIDELNLTSTFEPAKRNDEGFVEKPFMVVAGLDVSVFVDADGRYVIDMEWGEGSPEELLGPDGEYELAIRLNGETYGMHRK